MAQRTMRRHL